MSDSIWCGGLACLCILLIDGIALAKGGRQEVPLSIAWIFIAGLLLPVLNVYFVLKDAYHGRRKQASLGAILSVIALLLVSWPAWSSSVR